MEEDTVQYWIYPTEVESEGLSTLAEVWRLVEDSVQRYLWHQQLFNLKIVEGKEGWHLHGAVVYGENVEDEWMVVALLKYITSKMENVTARVTDSDGEIILIEAADKIPRWAGEPALADGRVFLYNGEVHLLPVCSSPGDATPFPCGVPDPGAASRFISAHPHLSRADPTVNQLIQSRTGELPLDPSRNHHTTTLLIPDMLAALIHNNNQVVSDLVQALRDQDHLDLRTCRTMARVRPESLGSYSVTFPRCLYALLTSISVRPHRSSGWKVEEKNKTEVLGFKLSLGLEILLSRYRSGDQQPDGSAQWEKLKRKLTEVGYFQGELEGSVRHTTLLENAKQFWRTSEEDSRHTRLDAVVEAVSRYKNKQLEAPEQGWLLPGGQEDSEAWLEVTPESLDQMLAAKFGVPQGGEENIPGELSSFLNKVSDMAGVEDMDAVNLDPNSLLSSLQKLLGGDEAAQQFSEDDLSSEDSEGEEDPIIVDYMSRLDAEVGKVQGRADLPDLDRPLEVDSSVLANLLASYSAELGFSGPASSLLNTLRINPAVKETNT